LELPDNESQIIYVVGGGPSLKGFDWERLRDKYVIVVCRAYQKVPWAKILYFTDKRFFEWYPDLISFKGIKVSGGKTEHPDIINYRFTGADGIELIKGRLRHGNNSGYAAINLAIQCGAKTIILLGFDMGGGHWHQEHPIPTRPHVYNKMIPHFDSLAEQAKKLGVTILNASPESRLEAFPKITLEQALLCSNPSA